MMTETDLLEDLQQWANEHEGAEDDFAYGWIPSSDDGFIWNAEVVQKAYTGDRDDSWSVQTVIKIDNRYFAIDGMANSWEGTEWTSGWYEVEPVQIQVTEYHRKLDY